MIKRIKKVVSYIGALVLSVIFALYLNANIGWFMLVALILAPVLSIILAYISSKVISVEADILTSKYAKGEKCEVTIGVKNKFIFPTTPIDVHMLNGDGVRALEKVVTINVMPLGEQSTVIKYEPYVCGPSLIGISEVRTRDFLRICSFTIKKLNKENTTGMVYVIPEIKDISFKDDRIMKIMQASLNDDDSEDTVETNNSNFGGFPGYDSREYVPGDPLKRINWKQSAKRDKLLVRLDDEKASVSVMLVLDSVFEKDEIDIMDSCFKMQFPEDDEGSIYAKIAEDAVESALGIAYALIGNGYKVLFHVRENTGFVQYELEEAKDVEGVRLELAGFSFLKELQGERLPIKEIVAANGYCLISTPNASGNVLAALEDDVDVINTSVFSAVDEIRKNNSSNKENIKSEVKKKRDFKSYFTRLKEEIPQYIIPYLLTLVLCVTMFNAYDVSAFSVWTVVQALYIAFIFVLCDYAKEHKLIGSIAITVFVIASIWMYFTLVRVGGGYFNYKEWFLSGGDVVDNTAAYLASNIVLYSMFFAMVIFFYSKIQYRIVALFLVSIIPFILFVKVIKEIDIINVMLVITLNVTVFLMKIRQEEMQKRIIGKRSGIAALILYELLFVLIAFAVPKSQETKYYYVFEELFLGGNTGIELPQQYGLNNEYSGNADGYNQLSNRKLYEVTGEILDNPLYLKRQNFDYYDFENDRWEYYSAYSGIKGTASAKMLEDWNGERHIDYVKLLDIFLEAERISPGFLDKYGLSDLKKYKLNLSEKYLTIEAKNFPSDFCIVPTMTKRLVIDDRDDVYVSKSDTFGVRENLLSGNESYMSICYDQFQVREAYKALGLLDFKSDDYKKIFDELFDMFLDKTEYSESLEILELVSDNKNSAEYYIEFYGKNNDLIPDRVVKLAEEITKDCQYDWQKAEALQDYFFHTDFVYDLEYDAPDDSVEYFLFNSRTGTCSDFASAYVLMARSVGLIVRYAEGFVPNVETGLDYRNRYVVRTNNSHAFAEVYLPFIGYTVFEATVPSDDTDTVDVTTVGFMLSLGARIVLIVCSVMALISIIIFVAKVLVPVWSEKNFRRKIKKMPCNEAVVQIYKRLLTKTRKIIGKADTLTPYQYGRAVEKEIDINIDHIIGAIEKTAFMEGNISEEEKMRVINNYKICLKTVKKNKKR